jgi:hypothetical protein
VSGSPSAASSAIRARFTSPAGADEERTIDSSPSRSPSGQFR